MSLIIWLILNTILFGPSLLTFYDTRPNFVCDVNRCWNHIRYLKCNLCVNIVYVHIGDCVTILSKVTIYRCYYPRCMNMLIWIHKWQTRVCGVKRIGDYPHGMTQIIITIIIINNCIKIMRWRLCRFGWKNPDIYSVEIDFWYPKRTKILACINGVTLYDW